MKFQLFWVNEAQDASMDCGEFASLNDAIAYIPEIAAELLDQCGEPEQIESLKAGSFSIEQDREVVDTYDWPQHPTA